MANYSKRKYTRKNTDVKIVKKKNKSNIFNEIKKETVIDKLVNWFKARL
jgi:hypothetical protein